MSEENLKYFGKYHSFSDSVSKKIWIGPMTQAEMEQEFPEYRHNIRNTRQSPESKKIEEAINDIKWIQGSISAIVSMGSKSGIMALEYTKEEFEDFDLISKNIKRRLTKIKSILEGGE